MAKSTGLKMGQLILSMGPAWADVRSLVQRAIIPSKRVIFTLVNTTHAINIMYMRVVICI
jgi:hypothetical protein